MENITSISAKETAALLQTLQSRFGKNTQRHEGIAWKAVEARLKEQPAKLWSLQEMERTGGEPDVVGQDAQTGAYLFYDCAAETPIGRRSLCYDLAGWESRKEARPTGNAIDMATTMGIELLTEAAYEYLQKLGNFDTKTSSWLKAPEAVRKAGGAIFGDRRYGRVFIYHNGPQSYYAGRGFRGVLQV